MVAIEDMKSGWTSSLSDSVIDTNDLGFCDKNFNLFNYRKNLKIFRI